MATKIGTPYGDGVLVKPDEVEQVRASGIIVASTPEKPTTGEVIAVGKGRVDANGKRVPIDVKPGDRVRFKGYGYDELTLEGTKYYLMGEQGITFIL